WATYYGGSGYDEGWSCATDTLGNVFLTGYTTSTNNISFAGYQNSHAGGFDDAFLVKFNRNGVLQWGTYFGGSKVDYAYDCATDVFGSAYLAGATTSTSNIAYGGHQTTFG